MLLRALPYLLSFTAIPLFVAALNYGGIFIYLSLINCLLIIPLADQILSHNKENMDPNTDEKDLFWFSLVPILWAPLQLGVIFYSLYVFGSTEVLSTGECVLLALNLGLFTGGIGLTVSHELIHKKSLIERRLGEALASSVLYGQYCIEHIYGHHIKVATPGDVATARADESIYQFLPRAVTTSVRFAWETQRKQLQHRGQSFWGRHNAFWRYGAWGVFWLCSAYLLGGVLALGFYLLQAVIAVSLLVTVDYIEHFGLLRKQLPNGKYEPVKPHHSWNADHRMSNYVLLNLQRHSDHHCAPRRPYPVLQKLPEEEAPTLPYSYSVLIGIALIPPLWFAFMKPHLEAWHKNFGDEEVLIAAE